MVKKLTPLGNVLTTKQQVIQNTCDHELIFQAYQKIDIRQIMSARVKSYYQITTPFGYAYTRSYGDSCKMKSAHNRMYTYKKIKIINTV